jgi:hypothetical protein
MVMHSAPSHVSIHSPQHENCFKLFPISAAQPFEIVRWMGEGDEKWSWCRCYRGHHPDSPRSHSHSQPPVPVPAPSSSSSSPPNTNPPPSSLLPVPVVAPSYLVSRGNGNVVNTIKKYQHHSDDRVDGDEWRNEQVEQWCMTYEDQRQRQQIVVATRSSIGTGSGTNTDIHSAASTFLSPSISSTWRHCHETHGDTVGEMHNDNGNSSSSNSSIINSSDNNDIMVQMKWLSNELERVNNKLIEQQLQCDHAHTLLLLFQAHLHSITTNTSSLRVPLGGGVEVSSSTLSSLPLHHHSLTHNNFNSDTKCNGNNNKVNDNDDCDKQQLRRRQQQQPQRTDNNDNNNDEIVREKAERYMMTLYDNNYSLPTGQGNGNILGNYSDHYSHHEPHNDINRRISTAVAIAVENARHEWYLRSIRDNERASKELAREKQRFAAATLRAVAQHSYHTNTNTHSPTHNDAVPATGTPHNNAIVSDIINGIIATSPRHHHRRRSSTTTSPSSTSLACDGDLTTVSIDHGNNNDNKGKGDGMIRIDGGVTSPRWRFRQSSINTSPPSSLNYDKDSETAPSTLRTAATASGMRRAIHSPRTPSSSSSIPLPTMATSPIIDIDSFSNDNTNQRASRTIQGMMMDYPNANTNLMNVTWDRPQMLPPLPQFPPPPLPTTNRFPRLSTSSTHVNSAVHNISSPSSSSSSSSSIIPNNSSKSDGTSTSKASKNAMSGVNTARSSLQLQSPLSQSSSPSLCNESDNGDNGGKLVARSSSPTPSIQSSTSTCSFRSQSDMDMAAAIHRRLYPPRRHRHHQPTISRGPSLITDARAAAAAGNLRMPSSLTCLDSLYIYIHISYVILCNVSF